MARWDLAERIQEWVHPLALDRQGRLVRAVVPGHEAKQYEVFLVRDSAKIECRCVLRGTDTPCQGNGKAVCYHSLAVVLMALRLQGCEFHHFEERVPCRPGERLIEVVGQGGRPQWLLLQPGPDRPAQE